VRIGTDVVETGTGVMGRGGNGYSVHGDGREWGSVSVPIHGCIRINISSREVRHATREM